MTNLKAKFFLSLILLASWTGYAQALFDTDELKKHYVVELIIFSNIQPDDKELWLEKNTVLDVSALSLIENKDYDESHLPLPYTLLNKKWLSMGDLWDRMRRSAGYHPILHISWYQPALDKQQAKNVYFYEGMRASIQAPSIGEMIASELDKEKIMNKDRPLLWDDALTDTLTPNYLAYMTNHTSSAEDPISIKGTARLLVGRYLHLNLDIIFSSDSPPATLAEKDAQKILLDFDLLLSDEILKDEEDVTMLWYYQLKQQRKIRRNEIHYFDHPRFGVIAKVSRFNLDVLNE